MVLQVQDAQPRGVPLEAVTAPVGLHQLHLGDPVHPVSGAGDVGAEVVDQLLPGFDHLGGLGVRGGMRQRGRGLLAGVLLRRLQVEPLDVQSGEVAAVGPDRGGEGGVVADPLQRGHRVCEPELRGAPCFDEVEDQRGASHPHQAEYSLMFESPMITCSRRHASWWA